jgi:hypothetical protein
MNASFLPSSTSILKIAETRNGLSTRSNVVTGLSVYEPQYKVVQKGHY